MWRCLLIPQEGAPPYFLSLQVSSETSSHTKSSSSQPSVLRQSHCCQKLWSSILFESKWTSSKTMIIDLLHRESTTRRTWWMRWIGTECGLRVSGMGGVAWRRFTYSSLLFVLLPNIFIFSCRSLPCFLLFIFSIDIVCIKCTTGSDCGLSCLHTDLSCSSHLCSNRFQNKK